MAISRTLRFQILRRDGNRCHYCGATAKEAKLTVDHVTAVALGGTDTPDNLVTACEPCNGGKSATPADAALVAGVQERQQEFQAAITGAVDQERQQRWFAEAFLDAWNAADGGELPPGWKRTIDTYRQSGLTSDMWAEIVDIALNKPNIEDPFRYCCGIARGKVKKIQEAAAKALDASAGGVDLAEDDEGPDEDTTQIHAAVDFGRGWMPTISDYRALSLAVSAALWEEFSYEEITHAAARAGELREPDVTLFLSDKRDEDHEPPTTEFHDACFDAWYDNWRPVNADAALRETAIKRFCISLLAAWYRDHDPEIIRAAASLAGHCGDTNVTHFLPHWSPRLARMEQAQAERAVAAPVPDLA